MICLRLALKLEAHSLILHSHQPTTHLTCSICTACVLRQRVCVGHLGSVILSLSHFCISAWLMEAETKLFGPSLWGRGLLWARLWARSSLCLLGTAWTFPSSPSSSSSSSSSWRGVEFRKGLSLRVMMSGTASFSLLSHRADTIASHGTYFTSKWSTHTHTHVKPPVITTPKERKSMFNSELAKIEEKQHHTRWHVS